MKLKKGVILAGLDMVMRKVLIMAEKVWKANGRELVITGGLDGAHSAGSLHYYGFALDLRTWYFRPETKKKVAKQLQLLLGSDYDVIVHKTHIHAEYDPKWIDETKAA